MSSRLQRRGGTFPREEIARVVDGRQPLAAHEGDEMPRWGAEGSVGPMEPSLP